MVGSNSWRIAAVAVLALAAGAAQADEPVVVGGMTPSIRPPNAPSIQGVHYGRAWFSRALHGIGEPYPASLGFLGDQGEWYTPFNRPGMTSPYDIRGWYRPR